MADLLEFQRFLPAAGSPDVGPTPVLNLYCWPCKAAHTFPLADVEKIVYALGADAADRGADADRVPQEDFISSCPKYVLKWADDIELYAEHVEQGVACRELGVTA